MKIMIGTFLSISDYRLFNRKVTEAFCFFCELIWKIIYIDFGFESREGGRVSMQIIVGRDFRWKLSKRISKGHTNRPSWSTIESRWKWSRFRFHEELIFTLILCWLGGNSFCIQRLSVISEIWDWCSADILIFTAFVIFISRFCRHRKIHPQTWYRLQLFPELWKRKMTLFSQHGQQAWQCWARFMSQVLPFNRQPFQWLIRPGPECKSNVTTSGMLFKRTK